MLVKLPNLTFGAPSIKPIDRKQRSSFMVNQPSVTSLCSGKPNLGFGWVPVEEEGGNWPIQTSLIIEPGSGR